MRNKGASNRLILLTACIPFMLVMGGCKKTWTPPRSYYTPTPTVKVVNVTENGDGKNGNSSLVPITTLFPGRKGQEGTLTPTPTATPVPTSALPTPTYGPGIYGTPTPVPTALPTPTPVPTPKPTNTPRPTKPLPTSPLPTAEPTATPTPGSFGYTLISATPTPRIHR